MVASGEVWLPDWSAQNLDPLPVGGHVAHRATVVLQLLAYSDFRASTDGLWNRSTLREPRSCSVLHPGLHQGSPCPWQTGTLASEVAQLALNWALSAHCSERRPGSSQNLVDHPLRGMRILQRFT